MAIYVANITIPGGADFQQTFYLENVNNNIKVRLDSTSKNPLNLTELWSPYQYIDGGTY